MATLSTPELPASPAANEDVVGVQVDTNDLESSPLLSNPSSEGDSVKSGPVWSPASLGPGFIWIQAGPSL